MKLSLRELIASIAIIVCSYLIDVAELHGETSIENNIRSDDVLMVPGIGARSVLIGDPIDPVLQKVGRVKFKISKPAAPGDLFKDVIHVTMKTRIAFDAMYYSEHDNYALCVYRGKVNAIIGFENSGITIDGVSLKSGINNFIFNYGNNVTRLQSGSHAMYIYQAMGIAVFDDDMNDTIDLYVVFSSQSRSVD
jgi:hypothetical protein